jgi:hypothetical protein
MSSDLHIRYRPRLDATPEAELEVLARVYRFLIQGWENRNAAASDGCADHKGGENNQSKAPSGSGSPSATDRREEDSDKPGKRRKEVITE